MTPEDRDAQSEDALLPPTITRWTGDGGTDEAVLMPPYIPRKREGSAGHEPPTAPEPTVPDEALSPAASGSEGEPVAAGPTAGQAREAEPEHPAEEAFPFEVPYGDSEAEPAPGEPATPAAAASTDLEPDAPETAEPPSAPAESDTFPFEALDGGVGETTGEEPAAEQEAAGPEELDIEGWQPYGGESAGEAGVEERTEEWQPFGAEPAGDEGAEALPEGWQPFGAESAGDEDEETVPEGWQPEGAEFGPAEAVEARSAGTEGEEGEAAIPAFQEPAVVEDRGEAAVAPVPTAGAEAPGDIVVELAGRLEALADALREEGAAALDRESREGDRLGSVLAGLLSGYLAGRGHA